MTMWLRFLSGSTTDILTLVLVLKVSELKKASAVREEEKSLGGCATEVKEEDEASPSTSVSEDLHGFKSASEVYSVNRRTSHIKYNQVSTSCYNFLWLPRGTPIREGS